MLRRLFAPIDNASLVAFRIAFGVLMLVAVLRYFTHGWIDQFFIVPRVFFPYPQLEWIRPLPATAMYALFVGLGMAAAGIATGCFYRVSVAAFAIGFTYAQLIDRTNYLNHCYLVSVLSGLLFVMPAHRAGSLDVRRNPALRCATTAAWTVWLLRFQLAVVYVFGAVAKVNADWLLRAQPLRIWLGANVDLPLVGPWLEHPWVAFACSYAGLAFDASVVPLLIWRRTRIAAYAAVVVFHLLTATLFPIGMFPWIMIALTPIFFRPDWPRRVLAVLRRTAVVQESATGRPTPRFTGRQRLGAAGLALYAAVQLVIPVRHWWRTGDVQWTEQGFRFAWQIMAMEKYGHAVFRVTDPATGAAREIVPGDELTPLQTHMMASQPDMILSYARHLAHAHGARDGHPVAVHADVFVTLNGRPMQRFVDPSIDLAAIADSAPVSTWLLPRRDS